MKIFNIIVSICILLPLVSCKNNRESISYNIPDFYYLYYMSEIDKLVGTNYRKACTPTIKYYIEHPQLLINEDKFDYLSNIYYLTLLTSDENEISNQQFKKLIFPYLEELQTIDGNFAFSTEHRKTIDSSNTQKQMFDETFLSTFMVLKIYSLTETELDEQLKNKVINWANRKLENNDVWNAEQLQDSGHIFLLREISKLLNINSLENDLRFEEYTNYVTSEFTKGKQFNNSINLLVIQNIIELNSSKIIYEMEPSILESILKLQTENGGFRFSDSVNGDVLSTYYAVKFLNDIGYSIPKKDRLIGSLSDNLTIVGCKFLAH